MSEAYRTKIEMNAKQIASGLMRAIASAQGISADDQKQWRIDASQIHFHDTSTTEIVWNDVQAILAFNEHSGENLPVPLVASEGYNIHHHESDYDGGYIGLAVHDHRDNFNGGCAFAIYHPGTSLPQQPFAI